LLRIKIKKTNMSAVFGLDQPLDARIKAAKQENKKRKPHNVNAAVDQHNKKKQKKQQGGNQNQHKGKKKELKSLPNIRVTVINDKANTQKKQQPVQKKQHLAGKPKSQNSVQGQKKHGPLTTKKLSTGKNVETQKKAQPLETSVNVKVWNVKHDISSVDFSVCDFFLVIFWED
jgi:hypothetical protein